MSNNLNDRLGETPEMGGRRFYISPPTPAEKQLELAAYHAYLDSQERMVSERSSCEVALDFPLVIDYTKRKGDKLNLSVRVRTARGRKLFSGPYIPVYRAFSLAEKLSRFFEINHYGCRRTRDIVDENSE